MNNETSPLSVLFNRYLIIVFVTQTKTIKKENIWKETTQKETESKTAKIWVI